MGKLFYTVSRSRNIRLSSLANGNNFVYLYNPNIIARGLRPGTVAYLGKSINRLFAIIKRLRRLQINYNNQ